MKFVTYPHRFADAIIKQDENLLKRYSEFTAALTDISDEELIDDFKKRKNSHKKKETSFKSITPSINYLLKKKMNKIPGWDSEVEIFNDEEEKLGNTKWRLDFACDGAFCVEVAFNHQEAIAWNLLKPVLACELNHVKKAVQGKIGIYVCATDALKKAGNIDGSSGSFENVKRHLLPLMNQLTIPIMIIGLKPFDSFVINKNAEIELRK